MTPPTPTNATKSETIGSLDALERTVNEVAQHWTALTIQVPNMVSSLFSIANMTPPETPDIPRWTLLCFALSHKWSLHSVLPRSAVLPSGDTDPNPPVLPPAPRPISVNATIPDIIDHVKAEIAPTEEHVYQLPRSESDSFFTYYTRRIAELAAIREWVDTEAAPVVSALLNRRDPDLGRLGESLERLEIESGQNSLNELERFYSTVLRVLSSKSVESSD